MYERLRTERYSPQGNGLTEPTGLVTSSRSSRSRSKGSPAYGSLLGTDNNSDTADVLGHHSDTMGGIIDGRFSYGDEGYVTVEVRWPPASFSCQHTMLIICT